MNAAPDTIVAKKIVEQLIKQQLLSEDKRAEWIKKLSFERVSFEDWHLLSDFFIRQEN